MTGLALILAVAVTGSQPSELAVRIRTAEARGMMGYGSGTILASNDRGEELILTARHVVKDARQAWVQYRGTEYRATKVHLSNRADLAALEVNLPGAFADVPIIRTAARESRIWGFGKSGGLHQHAVNFIRYGRLSTGGVGPYISQDYTPGGNDGDSGAGVFDQAGRLCGVFVAQDENQNALAVSAVDTCQFVGNPNAASGQKSTFIFPFFWKRVTWGGGSAGSCPPGQQPIVQPPTYPVDPGPVPPNPAGPSVAGQNGQDGKPGRDGIDGKPGKDGINGRDGISPDLTALIAANKANADAIAALTVVVQQIKNQPATDLGPLTIRITALESAMGKGITFVTPNLDGTTSSQNVAIGGTLGFKIPDNGLRDRVAALEAKVNSIPGK